MLLATGARLTNHWLGLALGCLGWLGLSLPARSQTSQLCIDETHFYQQTRITQRAEWGRTALREGYSQPAAEHLVAGLELVRASNSSLRAVVLENFIEANSASTGWLIHEVDRLVELGETDAVRTVLSAANETIQDMPNGYSALKIRLLTTIAADYGAIGDQAAALDLLAQARQLEPSVQRHAAPGNGGHP